MIVDLALYRHGKREPGLLDLADALEAARGPDAFVWIGLHEPSDEELDSVRQEFELHELAVEDALHAHQRPKVETYGSSLFVVLKTVRYLSGTNRLEFAELQLFVGYDYVVTVRHGQSSALGGVRSRLEQRPDLLAIGPSAVLHAVMDHVIDDYLPVVDALDADLQEAVAEVFTPERTNPAEQIFDLKRNVLDFLRNTEPLSDAFAALSAQVGDLVDDRMTEYFRDAHDHLLRVVARLQSDSTLLSDALAANLANISVRQNEDMRAISAWVAIAAIPTMIGGIYGMNFEYMPELDEPWAYPTVLAVISLLCFFAYRHFRRVGWL
ncbi:MAG: magnesium and cobalt transport protein CorA [Acidimicrobiales bacterium]|nr:magnesium and cobalt transport protein CorA [Acidimicrobiales bacterium]